MFNKIKKMHANMFCCASLKVRPGIAEEIYLKTQGRGKKGKKVQMSH